MATVAHLGPLVAILVNILQDLSMGSISKNVPLNELFQLSQSLGGGSCHGQTTGWHCRVTCRVTPCCYKTAREVSSQQFWERFSTFKHCGPTVCHFFVLFAFEQTGQFPSCVAQQFSCWQNMSDFWLFGMLWPSTYTLIRCTGCSERKQGTSFVFESSGQGHYTSFLLCEERCCYVWVLLLSKDRGHKVYSW